MNFRLKARKLPGAFAAATFLARALNLYANAQTPALASWNDGPAKQAIVSFVKEVTATSGTKYVEPPDRIATFDQDGTLWVEHPLYTQATFALARVHDLALEHPEWKQRDPFKAVLANDRAALANFSESDWEIILAATHAGMTTEAFQQLVKQWLATARDPRFHQPYTVLVYQPMLEVMDYLRANGFKTYIVTGGGQEFVRVYSQSVYGIPPEQVVGSSILTKYEYQDGGTDARAESVLHRRQCGKARRDQPVYRQAALRGVWQLDRRPADAGVDPSGRRRTVNDVGLA
jgi:phosphoglycolate phosphatase-like HAD superfamily hydrolase